MTDDPGSADARLRVALEAADPAQAARNLALTLKAEGMGQVELYRVFSRAQQRLHDADPRYDAVVDTMDLIWGWCAPGKALFDEVLSDERLRSEGGDE